MLYCYKLVVKSDTLYRLAWIQCINLLFGINRLYCMPWSRLSCFVMLPFQVMYGGFEVIGKLLIGNGKVFSASIDYTELFNGQDSMYIII